MKVNRIVLVSLLLCSSVSVVADVGVFAGVVYNFGSGSQASKLGFSVKVLSDDEEDKAVVAAGLSYFPQGGANKIGADISVGYLFDNAVVTGGYDFLNSQPQVGIGFADTDSGNSAAPVSEPSNTEAAL